MDVRLPYASIDAVVSQEAFCHVPDVKRAVTEAFRILRTDGRLALPALIDAASHLFDRRQLPADL